MESSPSRIHRNRFHSASGSTWPSWPTVVLHLYRNGVELGSTPCDGVWVPPRIKRLTIGGMEYEADGPTIGPCNFWMGKIDELAIFNHSLSAQQIQQLFTGKRLESTPGTPHGEQKP